ncbi:MAG TPA: nuclear transport factor 2 family protein [Acidimicrobiia bacterium]|nr:nuclear transport factor 2 family protein [Acidimicrobiia bacterium]
MTSNARRAATLVQALHAGIEQDRRVAADIYTDDVRAWTPAMATASLSELMVELERRDDSFSAIELEVSPLEVGGDYACVEWNVSMTHTGPLEVAGGKVVEPTRVRVTLNGITVAEFRGDRICSLRQYWDELSVFDQLGLLREGVVR